MDSGRFYHIFLRDIKLLSWYSVIAFINNVETKLKRTDHNLLVFGLACAGAAFLPTSPLLTAAAELAAVLAGGFWLYLLAFRGYRQGRQLALDDLARQRLQARLCPKCEYSLFGNITGICPECGEHWGETAMRLRNDFYGERNRPDQAANPVTAESDRTDNSDRRA